jgi:aerobic-type carbon monoxide dehydrogenase small subunit (CoxS/CutS family)
MSEEKKPGKISRRKFINTFGSGVVGTYTLIPTIQKTGLKEKTQAYAHHDEKEIVELKVNGKSVKVLVTTQTTLAELLREQLNLTGTKIVCNHGECGGCSVLLDGKAVYACHLLALDADGKEVLTIEGLLKGEELHPIQQAFVDMDGLQCGYCTPGQIMAAYALLQKNPKPTEVEIREGLAGNLCRCAAYPKIIDSVMAAAERMNR